MVVALNQNEPPLPACASPNQIDQFQQTLESRTNSIQLCELSVLCSAADHLQAADAERADEERQRGATGVPGQRQPGSEHHLDASQQSHASRYDF